MHNKTSDFIKRLRERAEQRKQENDQRLQDILERDEQNAKSNGSTPRNDWINTNEQEDIGTKKSSIMKLMRGDVTTKSSTNRGSSDD
jgi:hypothetical protein